MEAYYVYAYLDTRKQGVYRFNEYSFECEPIYIGKGIGNRLTIHLKEYYKANVLLKRKIGKIILETGNPPAIIRVAVNLSEDKAFEIEKELIQLIGRKDLKTGTLCNMTSGGEGMVNCSEETKEKLRKPFSIERRINISKGKKGKPVSKEIRDRLLSYTKVKVVHLDERLTLIKEYDTISEACLDVLITNASIHRYCTRYFNMADGTTFRYKRDYTGQLIYIKNSENDKKRKFMENSRKKSLNCSK